MSASALVILKIFSSSYPDREIYTVLNYTVKVLKFNKIDNSK